MGSINSITLIFFIILKFWYSFFPFFQKKFKLINLWSINVVCLINLVIEEKVTIGETYIINFNNLLNK